MTGRPIKHRAWVVSAAETIAGSVELLESGCLPVPIEREMIAVPVRRLLRGLYGGPFRAVWALLWHAVRNAPGNARLWLGSRWLYFWNLTILGKSREQYEAEIDAQIERMIRDNETDAESTTSEGR